MNNFDIKRFGRTLRWVVSVNFRKMLLWFVGSVLAVFLGEILFQEMNSYNSNPESMLRNFSQFLVAILVIVSLIMINSVVSSINEKRKREAFLMLPASNLEKYLSLVIYTTFICIACAFLAIVLGDSLRMLAYWALDYRGPVYPNGTQYYSSFDDVTGGQVCWWASSLPKMLHELTPRIVNEGYEYYPTDLVVIQLLFIYGGILWVHSVYTLGGTLLRKYSFVATSVVLMLVVISVVRLIVTSGGTMFHTQWNWENGTPRLVSYEIGVMGWILAIAFPILSALNYWASFHIFKRFQLITNKWFNYDFYKR